MSQTGSHRRHNSYIPVYTTTTLNYIPAVLQCYTIQQQHNTQYILNAMHSIQYTQPLVLPVPYGYVLNTTLGPGKCCPTASISDYPSTTCGLRSVEREIGEIVITTGQGVTTCRRWEAAVQCWEVVIICYKLSETPFQPWLSLYYCHRHRDMKKFTTSSLLSSCHVCCSSCSGGCYPGHDTMGAGYQTFLGRGTEFFRTKYRGRAVIGSVREYDTLKS